MLETKERPTEEIATDHEPKVVHLACPNIINPVGLCGYRPKALRELKGDEPLCIVCTEIAKNASVCQVCGESHVID